MDSSPYTYTLPKNRIAQIPMEPREHARLCVIDRSCQSLSDARIKDIPDLLHEGDLLILNDTRVFKARWHMMRLREPRCPIELFWLHPLDGCPSKWLILLKPKRACHINDRFELPDGSKTTLIDLHDDGTATMETTHDADTIRLLSEQYGNVPLPPYITPTDRAEHAYQSVFASRTGSVAAPTASLHLTADILARLEHRGIQTAYVTLHVGLGTFQPMRSHSLASHHMHAEWFHVPAETQHRIHATRAEKKQVIAIGTTVVRALESIPYNKHLVDHHGWTSLFIKPGFSFRWIDGLLTNFHLPSSTLLVLVSAFTGMKLTERAYEHAIASDYRFYSFGDAMFIHSPHAVSNE